MMTGMKFYGIRCTVRGFFYPLISHYVEINEWRCAHVADDTTDGD